MKTSEEYIKQSVLHGDIKEDGKHWMTKGAAIQLMESYAQHVTEEHQKEIERLKNDHSFLSEDYHEMESKLESQSQLLKSCKDALEQSEKLISSLISLGEGTDYEKGVLQRVEKELSKLSKHEQE